LVGKAQTPYWNYVKIGAEAAGEDLGISVDFFAPPEEDPAWQIGQIEELINKSVYGIAFAPSDTKSITPVILKAMQSDIPCIALDTDIAKNRHAFIGTGNYHAGQQAGEQMAALLDNKGKAIIVTDSSSNTDSLQRIRGFRDILAEYDGMEIIATLEKGNSLIQPDDVISLMESIPVVDAIFCTSDESGIAAAEAVKRINKVEQIKIVCMGESLEIIRYVQDGVIQAAVARRPYRMGYLSTLVLHNMAKVGVINTMRILPSSEIIDTGIVVVIPLNIDQYLEELNELGIKIDL
jgi:ribose transport system substrate-binding protein